MNAKSSVEILDNTIKTIKRINHVIDFAHDIKKENIKGLLEDILTYQKKIINEIRDCYELGEVKKYE